MPGAAGLGLRLQVRLLGSAEAVGVGGQPGAAILFFFFFFLTLPPVFTVSPQQDSRLRGVHLGDPQGHASCQEGGGHQLLFTSLELAPKVEQLIGGVSCVCSQLHSPGALGSPSLAAGLVCRRRVFCFTLGKDTIFPPVSVSPWQLRERGISQGHRAIANPTPQAWAAPGLSAMAPAWLWLQIFMASPARAHLPRGPATRLTPGSMKARVVRRSAGAGGIQTGCGTSIHLPVPRRAAEPLP